MAGELAGVFFAALLAVAPAPVVSLPPELAVAPAPVVVLPPEALVRALREARILGRLGQGEAQIEALERAVKTYPNEVLPLLALLEHHREQGAAAVLLAELRSRLAACLADPATPLSLAAVRRIATDPKTAPGEIAALAGVLEARTAGETADARTLEALLFVRQALDDIAAARATLDRLLAMNRTRERIAKGVDLAERAKDWPAATAFARELLAKEPGDRNLRYELGTFLARQGDLEALEIASDFAKDKRESSAARTALTLAWTLRDQRRDGDAETAFRRALAWDPENRTARAALLHLYASREEQDTESAALAARWAKEENPFALLSEGAHRLAAGDLSAAVLLLERAVSLAPNDDIAWYNLALAQIKRERWQEAEIALRRSIALKGERPEAHLQLGRVLQKLGRCSDAIAPLETALRLRPDLPQVHFYLYHCHNELGRAEPAAKHLRLHKEQTGAK